MTSMTRHDAPRPAVGPSEACFANAHLVLRDRVMPGAIHVADGRIAAITEGTEVPTRAVDCGGDYVIPGLVEVHTDNLERHLEPRPKVKLPHIPAILAHDGELASTGITTVFDALRVGSITDPKQGYGKYARAVATEILDLRAQDALRIRHLIHLRAEICSDTLLEELAEFGPEDRIGLVSLMDHTPGQRQFRDLKQLQTYYSKKYAFSQAQFEEMVTARKALGARVGSVHEAGTVAEATRLGATLASHDDTDVAHVERSRDLGIKVAEFPTTLEAADACRAAGIKVIMGAPNLIRGGSHSGNVSAQALAEADLLDIVSSDYVPALLLGSAFRLAQVWNDLPRAVRTVTETPAASTGLMDRGYLGEGALADLVRVQLKGDTPIVRGVWRGGVQIG